MGILKNFTGLKVNFDRRGLKISSTKVIIFKYLETRQKN